MLAGSTLLTAKTKRFIEFDVLRGIFLLMMSVDHSPSSLRRFTDQPLGFFSTAECFVFVSAFLAGMLYISKNSSGVIRIPSTRDSVVGFRPITTKQPRRKW